MCAMNRLILPIVALLATVSLAQQAEQVGVSPGTGARYATDAYPGFDYDKDVLTPERKSPKWFGFINGPKCDNAQDQFAYCRTLEAEENWSKAAKEYDALVREWPAAEEACDAQRRLAEILYEKEADLDDAFAEYRYLVDFYSFRCDYNAAVDRLYEIAGAMRREGKTIVFFRFRNTVEVRRAYECSVLRAPGAKWAPAALLTVGILREEEEKLEEAVKVYENLRNLHYGTPEAKTALLREAAVRMQLVDEKGYNRERCRDTFGFLELALRSAEGEDADAIRAMLEDLRSRTEDEAYKAACFYDSRTRTPRSAISAYERFLSDYPQSAHAEQVRARLEELKGVRQ